MARIPHSLALVISLIVLASLPSTPVAVRPIAQTSCIANGACPTNATADCDFFFQGFNGVAPLVLNLTAQPNVDNEISIPILYANTPASYVLKDIQNFGDDCSTNFASGKTGFIYNRLANSTGVFLRVRTTQKQANNGKFLSTCVKLPVTNAQLAQANGSRPINLNSGNKDTRFPSARWCLWFQVKYPQPAGPAA